MRFRDANNLIHMMKDIFAATKHTLVILIDEWDCLFREYRKDEQKGNRKAKYGSYLIKRLSQELSDECGTGFSAANIRNCRQLYLTFPKESYGCSLIRKIHWSHLRTIMRLNDEEERNIYLTEVAKFVLELKFAGILQHGRL